MNREDIIKTLKFIEMAADEYCKREDCPAKWLTDIELDDAVNEVGIKFKYEPSGWSRFNPDTDILNIPWSWFEDVAGRAGEIEAARAKAEEDRRLKAEADRIARERKDAEEAKRKEAQDRATLRRLAQQFPDELS